MESDRTVAETYEPWFFFDCREPFPIRSIAYKVYRESGKSDTSSHMVEVGGNVTFVVGYGIYFLYDIQHLYDLEHVFVSVGKNGEVVDVISSFHGKFLRSLFGGRLSFQGTHPILYSQPGKHAMMPSPDLFFLYPDLMDACGRKSGADGLLVTEVLQGLLTTDEEENRKVERYIRRHYAFVPSLRYELKKSDAGLLLPVSSLRSLMVRDINAELDKIEKDS